MSGSGRKALLDIREWWVAFKNVREWTGGLHGCTGLVGRPSWISGSDQDAHPDVQQLSGSPPGCPEVVGRPSRMCGSGGRPSRMSGSGQEILENIREW